MKKILKKIEKIRDEIEVVAFKIDDKKTVAETGETYEEEVLAGLAHSAFEHIWNAVTALNIVEEYLITAAEYEEEEDEEEEDDE